MLNRKLKFEKYENWTNTTFSSSSLKLIIWGNALHYNCLLHLWDFIDTMSRHSRTGSTWLYGSFEWYEKFAQSSILLFCKNPHFAWYSKLMIFLQILFLVFGSRYSQDPGLSQCVHNSEANHLRVYVQCSPSWWGERLAAGKWMAEPTRKVFLTTQHNYFNKLVARSWRSGLILFEGPRITEPFLNI